MSKQTSSEAIPRPSRQSCVLEVVLIELSELGEVEFERAFSMAATLLSAARGYCGNQVGRSFEEPSRALLMIWWSSFEDHTVRFRESPAYGEWRELLEPLVRPTPWVSHFQLAAAANGQGARLTGSCP